MKRFGVTLALALAALTTALPAAARDFVQDGAGLFSAGTVAQLDERIGSFNAQTGKEVVVVTAPSLNGQTLQNAAGTVFSEQRVNGVLIFIAKDDRKDIIVPGRSTAQYFPPETTRSIRESMESQFKAGDFDGGITTAVNGTLDVFRAHMNSLPGSTTGRAPVAANNYPARGGFHLSMFWWIVLIVVGFLILRSIMRSMSAPRYGPGPGVGGPPMGGPGYGGYYGGPGYYGGGGGGFWSGLLGGLGGAWLGNELFRGGGGNIVEQGGGTVDQGGGWGGGADSGGWSNDAGQADFGSSSSGDFSGGGFGGGDFGGGGGGDSGGGW
jgi:uncharacterized protein